MEHTLIQGPRGGFYWLDENGVKHYISGKAKKVAKAAKSGKTKNVKPAVKLSVVKRRYTGWFNVYNENGELIDDFKEWTDAISWDEALRKFRHDYPDTKRYEIILHTVEDVND